MLSHSIYLIILFVGLCIGGVIFNIGRPASEIQMLIWVAVCMLLLIGVVCTALIEDRQGEHGH